MFHTFQVFALHAVSSGEETEASRRSDVTSTIPVTAQRNSHTRVSCRSGLYFVQVRGRTKEGVLYSRPLCHPTPWKGAWLPCLSDEDKEGEHFATLCLFKDICILGPKEKKRFS